VLSFGSFSLHEQRKGTRSLDASGNAQDAFANLGYVLQAKWKVHW